MVCPQFRNILCCWFLPNTTPWLLPKLNTGICLQWKHKRNNLKQRLAPAFFGFKRKMKWVCSPSAATERSLCFSLFQQYREQEDEDWIKASNTYSISCFSLFLQIFMFLKRNLWSLLHYVSPAVWLQHCSLLATQSQFTCTALPSVLCRVHSAEGVGQVL